MFNKDRLEVRSARDLHVVATGDGILVNRFLEVLRLCWRNGTRMDDLDASLIVPAAGPPRFYSVERLYLAEERAVTIGQLLQSQARNQVSYEIGLRWFVHDSSGQRNHSVRGRDRVIGVLPARPTIVDGKMMMLVFMPGGDGPGVLFHEVLLEDSVYFDFLSAGEIAPGRFDR